MSAPKTVFCDIDGTLLAHTGDILENLQTTSVLPHVLESIRKWDKLNYRIILTTGRQESTRRQTEQQLMNAGIVYSDLIMGLPNGSRVVINDKKPNSIENTCYAVNIPRNEGLAHLDLDSKYVTVPDSNIFTKVEKPWGYEELVDINDKYVVKKLFMKKSHKCSIQYHKLKRETITVLQGSLLISIGTSLESMETREFKAFETITIEPYTVHRMEASEDCLYMETSTNELWDVVRLQDAYGRA
jgi:hydroxymethylpyrimidine pyrophosphatase-like HAD family hydrolase